MTTSVSRDSSTYAGAAAELLDSLFYAVSHDLRSPLLTISLSAQLLEHALEGVEANAAPEVLGGLRAACDDLERMLAALNALSRVSRRTADATDVEFASICAGAPSVLVALDETTVEELRTALPADAIASVDGDTATIRWSADGMNGSPLHALTGSLHLHAVNQTESLACLQIALERHRGNLEVVDEQVTVRLPIARETSS